MEKKVEKKSLKSSSWVKCKSKSRPGTKYLFNTATGERKWHKSASSQEKSSDSLIEKCKEKAKTISKPQKVPPIPKKNVVIEGKASATSVPPKERLKILQSKAIKDQLKTSIADTLKEKTKVSSVTEINKKDTETEDVVKRRARKRSAPESETVEQRASSNDEYKEQESIAKKPKNDYVSKESITPRTPTTTITKNYLQNAAKRRLLENQITQTPQRQENNALELKFLTDIPNNNYSSLKRYKCSANMRLQRLREKLDAENKLNSNVECNAMDWEPTEESNTNLQTFGSSASLNNTFEKPTGMEVDENLMLVAAEEKQEIKNLDDKWRKNSFYIVLDTNVFIQHLPFIENLITQTTTNFRGIILYIPYSVLQELDKLKMRENIKSSVVRAIRFLNKVFEEKDERVQAQSALEERNHHIDVESPDDSILNCCLQVQIYIPKVILFSEDVNLRNKAICNNIAVSTKSKLLEQLLQQHTP